MIEVIRNAYNLRPKHHNCVVTIGNFDGVHRGHQAVLAGLRAKSQELGVPSLVMIFEPLPREVFGKDTAPARISSLREKVRLLEAQSVDRLLVVRFNQQFANQSPRDFIQHWLIDSLGAKHLVVGDDFRFGHKAAGDYALLAQAGEQHGFSVEPTHSYLSGDSRVSSTRIREYLAAANFDAAEEMLGRAFSWSGRVVHGDKLGRTLGFPTANLKPSRKIMPVKGVFAVSVREAGQPDRKGVCNVGHRPSVDGLRPRVEVNVFDVERDYYGKHLELVFHTRLREEKKFENLQALQSAITKDAENAREYFNNS